jgi:hypothetical protein
MHQNQENEAAFGELHERLVAPAQETVELSFAMKCKSECQKMQRQENGQRQAGKPVHQRRNPKHAPAMAQVPRGHVSTTAATARSPSSSNAIPNATAKMPARRSSIGDHSVKTLRTPIAA